MAEAITLGSMPLPIHFRHGGYSLARYLRRYLRDPAPKPSY